MERVDLSDCLGAGKCNWTVSISPKASVRFDQALWGVCCTCSPRHIVGEEMAEGADKTCQQRLMEPPISASSEVSVFPMDQRVLIGVVQLQARRRAMSISTCIFSVFPIQPFPLYNNMQDQFMVAS